MVLLLIPRQFHTALKDPKISKLCQDSISIIKWKVVMVVKLGCQNT